MLHIDLQASLSEPLRELLAKHIPTALSFLDSAQHAQPVPKPQRGTVNPLESTNTADDLARLKAAVDNTTTVLVDSFPSESFFSDSISALPAFRTESTQCDADTLARLQKQYPEG